MGIRCWVIHMYRQLRGTYFYKILLLFVICISVPTVTAGLLTLNFSTRHSVMQANQTQRMILEEKRLLFEQKIIEVNKIITQLFSNDDLWSLVNASNLNNSHLFKMASMLRLFHNTVNANELLDSIYFYDDRHDFVLSDAKYTKDSFPDANSLLELRPLGNTMFSQPRLLGGRKVLSYVQKFSIPDNGNMCYFIVNLRYDAFFRDLQPYPLLISNAQHQLLFSGAPSDMKANHVPIERLLTLSQTQEGLEGLLELEGVKYSILQTYSPQLDWHYLFWQDYEQAIQPVSVLRSSALTSLAVVLVLSLLLAYVFTKVVYQPLSKMLADVKRHFDLTGVSLNKDEYGLIGQAFHQIAARHDDLLKKYNLTYPYFQKHSLASILDHNPIDQTELGSTLHLLGFEPRFDQYAVVLIEFEQTRYDEGTASELQRLMELYTGESVYIVSPISIHCALVIINTDRDTAYLYMLLRQLKEALNRKDLPVTISLGRLLEGLSEIGDSYRQARQQLENKFFMGQYDIIHGTLVPRKNLNIFYDSGLLDELLNQIRSQNERKAGQTLDLFTAKLLEQSPSMEYLKYVYFQICSRIAEALQALGIDLTPTSINRTPIFDRIQQAGTIEILTGYVHSLIRESVVIVMDHKSKQHTEVVDKTIRFIQERYTTDLSMDEIAGAVFLSPGYLGTIFKNETGFTVFDYITMQRLKAALRLLETTPLKIQDIAQAVGYNTVQSFMRLFKKHYGMTPIEYRRSRPASGSPSSLEDHN